MGYTAKQIATELEIADSTVETHMKKCKEKLGEGVNKKLTALWICKVADIDFDDLKRQVLELIKQSAKVIVIVLISSAMLGRARVNNRGMNSTRARIEVRARAYTSREFA